MPGIKAIPVPAEEEAPETIAEPAEEKKETEAKEEAPAQIQEPKRKRRTKAEIEKEKAEKAVKKLRRRTKNGPQGSCEMPRVQERTHECPHTFVQAHVR